MIKRLITIIIGFCMSAAMAAVDANKASHNELTEIKGIGPATATRIVEARKQEPFKNWDDLIARVKGIAETSAAKFSDNGLTVNGQTFKPTGKPSSQANKNSEKASKPTQTAGKKAEKS